MSNRFTEKAEKALNGAVRIAESFGHTYIGSEHILLSLAETQDSVAAILLNKHGATAEKIKKAIKEYSGEGLKSALTPKDMTPCSKKIVENSYRISVRYNAQRIGTEHILLALLEEKEAVSQRILSYVKTDVNILYDEILTLLRSTDRTSAKSRETKEGVSALRQHGKNLTAMARDERIDPVIGREKETDRLIRILSRKNKNNPCLIGEAGVGKTAIVEGLAQRIVANDVPPNLCGKEIISVDLTSMVSGTKYRGDFEERIKSLLNEATSNKSIILFIDELHTIVGAGAAEGAIDAANILKPQLSRGELQIIGATTFSEYHKYIERDPALERRFQPISVSEPDEKETKRILEGVKSRYEMHHGVIIDDSAIDAAVRYSTRYIQDRFLPDKALDILDEACAKVNEEAYKSKCYFNNISDYKLRQIDNEKEIALKSGDIILAKNLHDLSEEYKNAPCKDTNSEKSPTVTEKEIKEIINEITGIPLVGIGRRVNKRELFSVLSDKIIGQDEAIELISGAIARSECGISSAERPKGFYLFVGASGIGKTELASAIADALFFDKSAFIKLDMSEFSEANSVTKLIGSPPGYAGHDEGGALTEKVRRHPYSIILFDEIEKAHRDILDLLLQIADCGILTDSSSRRISFKNCYVILTSNVYTGISDSGIGFGRYTSAEDKLKNVREELGKHFRLEFINRIDEIIPFSPISLASMTEIAKKRLNELSRRIESVGCTLEYSESVPFVLAKKAESDKFGVRNLIRIISRDIEGPISDMLTERDSFGEITIYLDVKDNKISAILKEKAVTG